MRPSPSGSRPLSRRPPGTSCRRKRLTRRRAGRVRGYDEVVHAALPTYPFWYLGVLGTHPDSAGRGWGRAVMRAGLERAAADGLPAILETSKPGNVELYRRAGWEVVGSLSEPVPTWIMQQPPR
ncbi:GNAT family N-acetyltransferase [Micromonospora sp. M12]